MGLGSDRAVDSFVLAEAGGWVFRQGEGLCTHFWRAQICRSVGTGVVWVLKMRGGEIYEKERERD